MPSPSPRARCVLLALGAAVALVAGCAERDEVVPGGALEYRWAGGAAFQPLERTDREPPGRPAGDAELVVRTTVPRIAADDPALDIAWPIPLASVRVGGRPVAGDAGKSGIFPLDRGDSGRDVELVYRGPVRLLPGPVRFGSQRALWVARLRADLPSMAAGVTLAVAGLLIAVVSVRRRASELHALALFALSAGGFASGQSPFFRSVLWASPGGWRVATAAFAMLLVVGLVRFAASVFGDTRFALLRRGASALFALGAVEVLLHVLGVVDLSRLRRLDQAMLFVLFAVALARIGPKARAGDRPAAVFLAGLGALLALAVPDIAWGLGLPMFERNTTPFGLLAFLVALGFVARSWQDRQRRDLAASRAELELRVVELEGRTREIETLNDELRRQIEKRSRELGAALARAPGAAPSPVLGGLEAGSVVDRRYRVVANLGAGAMGAVYDVERTTDGKRFALKIMTGAADARQSARFAREAEVAARVKHPNVVAIVDVGVDPEGFLFLVMERVVGRSLEQARGSFGEIDWGLDVLLQTVRGLGALHARGVVHRDLKPSNVLLDESGEAQQPVARVADLGVARDLGEAVPYARTVAADARAAALELAATPRAGELTAAGAIVGTPVYTAPELASGAPAGPEADVFSFGILAWEVLTGAYPFPVPPLLHALARGDALSVASAAAARVPEVVREALRRAVAWTPGERPSAAELEVALERAVEERRGCA